MSTILIGSELLARFAYEEYGQWFLFDPSKLAPLAGLVRLGAGRDAADVAFATISGNAILSQEVVWAAHSQDLQPLSANGQSAISTA